MGGGVAVAPAWFRSEKVEVGDGMRPRRQVRACSRAIPEGEKAVPRGRQLEAGPVVGRAGLREARGRWAGRQGGGQGWEYLRM